MSSLKYIKQTSEVFFPVKIDNDDTKQTDMHNIPKREILGFANALLEKDGGLFEIISTNSKTEFKKYLTQISTHKRF
jgi:hypothetical protein